MLRRTFLRGSGVLLGLPLLDAMRPARAAAPASPVRSAFLYFPNGVWRDGWIPKTAGADYELPFSLAPLAKIKSEVLVLTGLDKRESIGGDGHYAKTANFLTGLKVTKTTGKDINVGGVSVDQYLAAKVGKHTPLPSLELGTEPVTSGIDGNVGYTRLYGSYIAWRDARTPVAKEINPRLVYERLFGKPGASADDQSLLDLTLDDATRLRGKLGRDDQFKLDEYLDAVRSVEKRLEFANKPDAKRLIPADGKLPIPVKLPAGNGMPKESRDHVQLMLDLMVLAFWADATRVITFMFANDVSGRNFSFLDGVRGGHHDMSHHQNQKEKAEQYQRIVKWHVERFADLCTKLQSIREGESNLLDNSQILLGSSLSDGNSHDPLNLPILVGGRGGKALRTGRHIACPKKTPLCNLYVSLLATAGAEVQAFGDSTGPLKELA